MKLIIEVPDNVVQVLSKDKKYTNQQVELATLISIYANLYRVNQHIPEITEWVEKWYLDQILNKNPST